MLQTSCDIKPLGRFSNNFQTLLIIIVMYVNTIQFIGYYLNTNYLWLFTMVSWFVFVFLKRPNFFFRLPSPLMAMSIFTIYTIVFPYFFGNSIISNRYIGLAQLPFFYFAFVFNEKTGNMKMNYRVIKWSIPPIIFVAITTVYELLKNPYASRQAFTVKEDLNTDFTLIGGYDFIYSLSILAVILFAIYNFFNIISNSKSVKIILLLILIFFVVTVFMSNFFTAIAMFIFSVFYFYLIKKNNFLSFLFLLPVLFIVIFILRQDIISMLIGLFDIISPEGKNITRLIDLQLSSSISGINSIMSDRNETYFSSLGGFIEHPLFGKIVTPLSVKDNFFTGFGQHSQLLDTLALFGLMGFVQIYFLIKIFSIRLKKGYRKLNAFTLSVMMSVIILNLFNNTTALCGFVYFFVYPSTYNYIYEKMSTRRK